ncbi:MAG: hypothetical protein ACXWR0_10265 [Bdellovibrio sp.]
MNLSSLIFWSLTVITALVETHHIDVVQRAILRAQARLIFESRTNTWGKPKLFTTPRSKQNYIGEDFDFR